LVKDFDPLRVVFMIEEVHILFDQFDGAFVNPAVQGDSSITINFTPDPGAEEIGEILGRGSEKVKMPGVAIPGRFFCRAMDGSMIGLITPLFELFVEVGQREGGRKKGKKLHSEAFEPALDFSFPFGPVGGTVNQGDSQGSGGMSQLVRTERRPIVEINFSWESSFAQGFDQAIGQIFEIFLQIELPMGNEAGVVIQKSEEETLPYLPFDDHRRPVHTVGLPDVIGELRFIPPEIWFEFLGLVEPSPLEEPVKTLDGGVKVGR
jgi:hypothetical protein